MPRQLVPGPRTLARAACLALLACTLAAPAAAAQDRETLEALADYRLTMPTIRKLMAAGGEVDKSPAEASQVRDATMDVDKLSIKEAVAVIERYPAMKRAVAGSGLSAREFATALLSLNWAVRQLANEEMRKAQGQSPPAPPAHVPKENVELVRRNMAEIERLSQK